MGTEEVLTTLSRAEGGKEPGLADWVEQAGQYRTPSTSLILVTTRPESELHTLNVLLETAFDEPILNATQVSVAGETFQRYFQPPEFD